MKSNREKAKRHKKEKRFFVPFVPFWLPKLFRKAIASSAGRSSVPDPATQPRLTQQAGDSQFARKWRRPCLLVEEILEKPRLLQGGG
jgi:hypothetical protein